MNTLPVSALLAGLAGTTLMLVFLRLLARGLAIEARLPLALGALVTGGMERAARVGLILHYAIGIAFGFLYAFLIREARPESHAAFVFLAMTIGLIHGVFTTMLMIVAAERHPLKSFRESPVASSLVHGVAHIVYGLGVGLTLLALSL